MNMGNDWLDKMIEAVNALLSPEWIEAALVMAFLSTLVVAGVFGYLNRHTKREYFSLWTVAWLYYGLWMAACIGLEESPDQPLLIMARRACIGISALCMFWGSFELTRCGRNRRELGSAIVMIVLWSYVAAYLVRDQMWITAPVFVLLASASVFTGLLYINHRGRSRAANLLTTGFILWGLHLIAYPLQPFLSPRALALSYFTSAILALFIAMGMMVQILEEARERNETLLGAFKKSVMTRRLLEEEIAVSKQKYQSLFDWAGDAIFLVDLETFEILEANRSACQLVDAKGASLSNRSFLDLCPTLRQPGNSLLENKRMVDEVIKPSCEFHIVRANGDRILCEGSANLVKCNKRSMLQIHIREITERKRLEQQLRQSEKLSALGRLIAGVAHELNNPLAVIMGYSQLLARQDKIDARVKNDVTRILGESERAAKIVRNLLTFARPRDPQMATLDLNRLILNFLKPRERELLDNNITLVKRLASNLPGTAADPHQIEQVLSNLYTNAVQALVACDGPRTLELATEVSGKALRITVADSGPGIAPEIVSKIFDPFFTTKSPGKGTGLGLSISHSIVEEHGGKIWVQSERGKGTRLFVELPIASCPIEPDPKHPAPVPLAPDPNAAQFRVLVVDDEPGIVELLKAALGQNNGYTVETAPNGDEALQRIESNRYDLIISDLCMPGIDGETLYKSVRDRDPALAERIVFITGDTVSTRSRAFLEWTGNRWFGKPFKIREIEEVVGNFLHEQALAGNVGAR